MQCYFCLTVVHQACHGRPNGSEVYMQAGVPGVPGADIVRESPHLSHAVVPIFPLSAPLLFIHFSIVSLTFHVIATISHMTGD